MFADIGELGFTSQTARFAADGLTGEGNLIIERITVETVDELGLGQCVETAPDVYKAMSVRDVLDTLPDSKDAKKTSATWLATGIMVAVSLKRRGRNHRHSVSCSRLTKYAYPTRHRPASERTSTYPRSSRLLGASMSRQNGRRSLCGAVPRWLGVRLDADVPVS